MPGASLWECVLSWSKSDDDTLRDSRGESKLTRALTLYEDRHWKAALDEAWPLAKAGSTIAQALIANVYAQGRLGEPDFRTARKWWLKAAEAGHTASQKNVGLAFLHGDGGPPDSSLAKTWLMEAILGGDAEAMSALGTALVFGAGMQRDPALGYMWLRTASPFEEPAFTKLPLISAANREQAQTLTPAIANIRGSHCLQHCRKRNSLAYLLNTLLIYTLSVQRNLRNTATETKVSIEDTLIDVALQQGEYFGAASSGLLFSNWVFYRRECRLNSPEAIPISVNALWEIVRPCDQIEICDGINSHLTVVHGIDREAERIYFADPWPEEFLLLQGRNVEGVRAIYHPLGKTKTLLSINKQEFLRVAMGTITMDTEELPIEILRAFPDLQADPAVHYAIGAMMVQHFHPVFASAGTGWLWSLAESDMAELVSDRDTKMFADRLLLGMERCRQSGREQLRCINLRTMIPFDVNVSEAKTRACRLLEKANLSTLPSAHAANLIDLKATHDGNAAAMSLATQALARSPENEYLLYARAAIMLREGRTEDAKIDLDHAVVSVQSRLAQRGPVFRNSDGRLTGNSEKKVLGKFLGVILIVRMQAAIASGCQDTALVDGYQAISHGADSVRKLTDIIQEYRGANKLELAKQAEAVLDRLQKMLSERN